MQEIDPSKPILVTGGSGYLASWIVKLLLEKGLQVHTTVRDSSGRDNYLPLEQLSMENPGRLKIFEADLLLPNSFMPAMRECELVIHTASPFIAGKVGNAKKEIIQPALQGTRNVLFSATDSGRVKRVVLTSSIVAMAGNARDIRQAGGIINEKCWNHSSTAAGQPYSFSKTIAEREAWRLQRQQAKWDLVVINPGFILGPSLSRRTDPTSIKIMKLLLTGAFRAGVPKGAQAVVDVRDVAKAHLQAGMIPHAGGRHLATGHLIDFLKLAAIIRDRYPRYPLPCRFLPLWLIKLGAPLSGLSAGFIEQNTGFDFTFDNRFIREDLQLSFRPIEQTIIDHVNQLANDHLVKDKRD